MFVRWLVTGISFAITACHPEPSSSDASRASPHEPSKPLPILLPITASQELRELSPDAFYEKANESVVLIRNPDADALGSGVEIYAGVFVTNCHVLEDGSHFYVERNRVTYPASLTRSDSFHDICLLTSDAGSPHPVRTRSAMEVRVGERVYALGNPQGFELTLSEGLVSQLRKARDDQVEPYIQTTAAISQGSSGGGLFDRQGRLIGISSFMSREGQNLNFAAPIDWAIALAAGKQRSVKRVVVAEQGIENAKTLNAEAINLLNAGNALEAVPLLEQARALDPSNAEIAGNLGYGYMLVGKYEDAREELLGTLKASPKRAATWLNLGETYAELGEKEAAIRSVVNGYVLSTRKQRVRDALSRVALDDQASEAWKDVAAASLFAIKNSAGGE